MISRSFRIRPGEPADAPMLADLGARTFRDAYADLIPAGLLESFVDEAFGVEIQASELSDRGSRFFIAEEDGEPLGYAFVQERPAPEQVMARRPLVLARLYVDTAAQGRRVGTRLWDAILGDARTSGNELIWLTVWEHNRRAIEVYRRWGFADAGSIPFDLAGERQTDRLMVIGVDLTPGFPAPVRTGPPPGETAPPAS